MERDETRTPEHEDGAYANPAPARSPARRPTLAMGALVALLLVALGATAIALIAIRPGARSGTKTTARSAPIATPAPSLPQPPIAVAGLPKGAEITNFALTGFNQGWATAVFDINPVTSAPDHGAVLRFTAGAFTQVGPALPGAFLSGLSMDSPTEGWVTGAGGDGKGLLLHISDGGWTLTPPPAIDPVGWPEIMKAPTPDERWLVMANRKFADSGLNVSLLHYNGSAWSLIGNTPHEITDIAPVSRGKAWVIGVNRNGSSSLVLVQGGMAKMVLTSPPNADFLHLRVFGPHDIWIEGSLHAASNNAVNDQPLAYHYDGASWSQVDVQAPHHAQHIAIIGPDAVWSYTSYESAAAVNGADKIDAIYSNAGGHWRTLSLPYDDLQSLTVVSSSSADVWAIGVSQVTAYTTSGQSSSETITAQYTLLHYAGGVWTEYGRS